VTAPSPQPIKFNYRICEDCWAEVKGLARAKISVPPGGGICELCEANPAVIYKGLSHDEYEWWYRKLGPTPEPSRYRPRGFDALCYLTATLGGGFGVIALAGPYANPIPLVLAIALLFFTVVRALRW
jgi:hypothetical protein